MEIEDRLFVKLEEDIKILHLWALCYKKERTSVSDINLHKYPLQNYPFMSITKDHNLQESRNPLSGDFQHQYYGLSYHLD